MEVIFLIPKAIQNVALIASLVFLMLTQLYALVVMPFIVSSSGTGPLVTVNGLVFMAFGVLGALSWWHVYAHTKGVDP